MWGVGVVVVVVVVVGILIVGLKPHIHEWNVGVGMMGGCWEWGGSRNCRGGTLHARTHAHTA